jgi:hypothetical protein
MPYILTKLKPNKLELFPYAQDAQSPLQFAYVQDGRFDLFRPRDLTFPEYFELIGS